MEIKHLEKKDLVEDFFPLIVELECGAHYDASNSRHEAWISRRLDALYALGGHALCLYNENGRTIGLLFLIYDPGLVDVRCFGKKASIAMFGLFPDYRSKGLAANLLRAAERFLIEKGCQCLYVDTYAGNAGAIRYYTREGFIPVAYHPGENGLDDKGQVYLYKELPIQEK
jgi:GNAT superfamily N-acetyltransferase